ncbi:hypothetical protein ACIPY2_05670 [Paenarthrobacter sp. NPDC089675]|uniref:hypothetical protein n=1 Tax=Paenarthrobacter sp. NPDC089675 TaxID=3364376 RepID=UPI0038255200
MNNMPAATIWEGLYVVHLVQQLRGLRDEIVMKYRSLSALQNVQEFTQHLSRVQEEMNGQEMRVIFSDFYGPELPGPTPHILPGAAVNLLQVS